MLSRWWYSVVLPAALTIFAAEFAVCTANQDQKSLNYKPVYGEKAQLDMVALSRRLGIRVECVHEKMVALTFDDGPEENTEQILNHLAKRGVPATFFVIGNEVYNNHQAKQLLKRMKREGHTIATHSIAHMDMSWMSYDDILRNLQEPAEAVASLIGRKPRFMRPPFGSYSQAVIDVAKENGYEVINWNVDSNDWRFSEYDRPSSVMSQIESQEGPGRCSKIVLMHDHYYQKQTLDSIIKFYRNNGYYFVNMRDCLGESAYFGHDASTASNGSAWYDGGY